MFEDTLESLYAELEHLQDAVQAIDMNDPQAEAKIEYLEGCIDDVRDEIEDAERYDT